MNVPPLIPPSGQPYTTGRLVPRWASAVMLALFAGYILFAAYSGSAASPDSPALPSSPRDLFYATVVNLLVFGAVAAAALLVGRPSRADLYCAQKVQVMTFIYGFTWSLLLRALLLVVMLAVVAVVMAGGSKVTGDSLQQFRPKLEHLFDPKALANPVYVALCTTWVSFVVAGAREELWRAGVIASLRALFPAEWPGRRWEWTAVVVAALLFGLGHLTQGWGAVGLTTVLGLGLGAIMILRRSLPEAILAHGFFDALTFAGIALIANRDLLRRLVTDPELLRQLDQILRPGGK